jgi:hypothetical protein
MNVYPYEAVKVADAFILLVFWWTVLTVNHKFFSRYKRIVLPRYLCRYTVVAKTQIVTQSLAYIPSVCR